MTGEESFLYVLIGVIVLVSVYGFNNIPFTQKFLYNQGRVQNEHQYYRMLTSSFLHADLIHLGFNMYVLYQFGRAVIIQEGALFFGLVYFLSVLGGSIMSYFLHLNQWMYSALGASGGVSGILMAFVVFNPDVDLMLLFLPIPIPGYIFIFLYMCYEVYSMIKPHDNIGHDAHIGGALVGAMMALILNDNWDVNTLLKLGLVMSPLLYALFYSFQKIKEQN